jgi:two-component system chemotaxis sensor kinase CheA/two-component system sensor histidine kinase and response regulator WspE
MATILIVDDEADCRRPLAALLEYEGYTIKQANDGLEGLQKLAEFGADLVLLDMVMPGVDGITMLQAIRKQAKWAQLPVLLVTGAHDPQKLHTAKMVGVQEYIFKGDTPFSRMLELVKRHLGEHHVPKRRGRKPKPRPDAPAAQPKPVGPPRRIYTQLQLEYLGNEDAA